MELYVVVFAPHVYIDISYDINKIALSHNADGVNCIRVRNRHFNLLITQTAEQEQPDQGQVPTAAASAP
jgi:hypothetical protein